MVPLEMYIYMTTHFIYKMECATTHPIWWSCGEAVLVNMDATRWSASFSQSGRGTPSCSHEPAQHTAWRVTSTAVSLLDVAVSLARMFSNRDKTKTSKKLKKKKKHSKLCCLRQYSRNIMHIFHTVHMFRVRVFFSWQFYTRVV